MTAASFEDAMMARALSLSAERSEWEFNVRAEALLVGGIAPYNLRADERLRARELLFLADAREAQDRRRAPLARPGVP